MISSKREDFGVASSTRADATQTLVAHAQGDPRAVAELLPLVYANLRALAANYMRQERSDHTLQPTALVHEAYIKMIEVEKIDWQGKTHFFAIAARQMRRVLVEHARKAKAQKRGARPQRISLDENVAVTEERTVDLLALEEALEKLARRNQRHSEVAELRFLAGMSEKETAFALGVSERTVREDWRVARAWLSRELTSGHEV